MGVRVGVRGFAFGFGVKGWGLGVLRVTVRVKLGVSLTLALTVALTSGGRVVVSVGDQRAEGAAPG